MQMKKSYFLIKELTFSNVSNQEIMVLDILLKLLPLEIIKNILFNFTRFLLHLFKSKEPSLCAVSDYILISCFILPGHDTYTYDEMKPFTRLISKKFQFNFGIDVKQNS